MFRGGRPPIRERVAVLLIRLAEDVKEIGWLSSRRSSTVGTW